MRVATIPPGAPFLETLVAACLDGSLGVPFDRTARDFSQAVIFVPTRRAARALAHAFADALQPRAVLLPRIVPLGDPADLEEQAILSGDFTGADDAAPAVSPLRRKLMLAPLVEAWRQAEEARARAAGEEGFTLGSGFADSFQLADALGRLIDEAAVEGADWSRLAGLADAEFDEFWRQTRTFLEIAGGAWPQILRDEGLLDPAERRNTLLRAEAERLRSTPPEHPVIAAGSTGTVPATAELLQAIARLPQGAVVLPGLDLTLDDAAWDVTADDDGAAGGQPGHPQAALKRLLARLGVARRDVVAIGSPTPALAARGALLAAAARPAEATDAWPALREAMAPDVAAALADVAVIEAADEREEAAVIGLVLREVLETEAATAALVTPDRALAGRVCAELKRWGVRADDSAGTQFSNSPLGALAALVLQAVREEFPPAIMLAIAESPCLDGDSTFAGEFRAALELAALRGVAVEPGLAGFEAAMKAAAGRISHHRARRPLRRTSEPALAGALALGAAMVEALRPLAAAPETATLADFAGLHAQAIEALAGPRATAGPDGMALAALFDGFAADGAGTRLTCEDYAGVFAAEAGQVLIPPSEPVQGRIKIWGLLEARLMHADRIVLGGLNETLWPAQPRQDPFLNRAMRTALGLALPERRIGQSAHDFAQALGAPEAFIVRARMVEGTPMVASRFLRRLDAMLGEDEAKALRTRGARHLANARMLDQGPSLPPASRPTPRPRAELQPLSLSVTDIAGLIRDPYAIYARDVLGLDPLDPLQPGLDASDRGNIIHAALARFMEAASADWPDDPLAALLAIGREEFAAHMENESVAAFWWPTFARAAAWFVEEAGRRRPTVAAAFAEKSGALPVPLADGAVLSLRGRGDLFERMTDGTLAVTDYKTGVLPGEKEVRAGNQPQLTLMAAMVRAGVISGVPAGEVGAIRYVKIGQESFVREVAFKAGEPDLPTTAARHLADLAALMGRLRAGEEAYISRRKLKLARDGGPYDHLARVKEWLSSGGD